jgi:hypothetical protein
MRVDIHWRGDRAMATLTSKQKVKKAINNITHADNIKVFLLEWLVMNGSDDKDKDIAIADYYMQEHIMYRFCCDVGLLDEVQDPFTKKGHVRLTKKGLDYVKRKNNDTTE